MNNWAQEFEKWINGRVKTEVEKVKALAVSATDKKSVLFAISQFLHVSKPYDVLIISSIFFFTRATNAAGSSAKGFSCSLADLLSCTNCSNSLRITFRCCDCFVGFRPRILSVAAWPRDVRRISPFHFEMASWGGTFLKGPRM